MVFFCSEVNSKKPGRKLNSLSAVIPIYKHFNNKYNCMLIDGSLNLYCNKYKKKKISIEDVALYLSRIKRIKIFFSSLLSLIFLFKILYKEEKFKKFFLNRFFTALFEIFYSHCRYVFFKKIFKEQKIKLFLTHNEKLQVSNELSYIFKEKKVNSILACSEHATHLLSPVYANKIFVLDNIFKKDLIKKKIKKTNIIVVGSSEIDFILSELKTRKKKYLGTKDNIFIFISDFLKNDSWNRYLITKQVHNMIIDIAKNNKKWNFYIKPRPNHYNAKLPLIEIIKKTKNIKILSKEYDLIDLINLKNKKVFGGISSLALYTTSNMGFDTLVFKLYKKQYIHNFINKKGVIIENSNQFTNYLSAYSKKSHILNYHSKYFKNSVYQINKILK